MKIVIKPYGEEVPLYCKICSFHDEFRKPVDYTDELLLIECEFCGSVLFFNKETVKFYTDEKSHLLKK